MNPVWLELVVVSFGVIKGLIMLGKLIQRLEDLVLTVEDHGQRISALERHISLTKHRTQPL